LKIEQVDITVIERDIADDVEAIKIKGQSQSLKNAFGSVLVLQIHCAGGISGASMTIGNAPALARELARYFRSFLIGRDIRYREAIWQNMWSQARLWLSHPWAIGLVDTAIWDAYAKSLSVPLHQLLGGYRERVPVYASSLTLPSVEAFVEEALHYQELGYQGYKMHVFGDAKKDIELCTKVREAVGDDWPLMVDAVAAYHYLDALKVGRVLGELDYTWFEEPLRDYELHGYRQLCRQLDVPVMAGETHEGFLYSIPDYITSSATDIVRADVMIKGGISQVMKIAALAEAHGMLLEVHTFSNPLIDMANLASIAAIKNTTFFEQPVPREIVTFGMVEDFVIDSDGHVIVPQKPGIGLDIDWDYMRSHTVERL
jgi:L-alanine-DL-glutamate epimerase-like enolase superfamily enzyme